MYNVKIRKTVYQSKTCERIELVYDTTLPFPPMIGMYWEDEDKGINIKVDGVSWVGCLNYFAVTNVTTEVSQEEFEYILNRAKEKKWEIYN